MENKVTFLEEADNIVDYILKNEDDIRTNSSEAKEYISDIIVESINFYNKKNKGKKIENN